MSAEEVRRTLLYRSFLHVFVMPSLAFHKSYANCIVKFYRPLNYHLLKLRRTQKVFLRCSRYMRYVLRIRFLVSISHLVKETLVRPEAWRISRCLAKTRVMTGNARMRNSSRGKSKFRRRWIRMDATWAILANFAWRFEVD